VCHPAISPGETWEQGEGEMVPDQNLTVGVTKNDKEGFGSTMQIPLKRLERKGERESSLITPPIGTGRKVGAG